eukprot:201269_1
MSRTHILSILIWTGCYASNALSLFYGYNTNGTLVASPPGYPLNSVISCAAANNGGLCDVDCVGNNICRNAAMSCYTVSTCELSCRGIGTCEGLTFDYGSARDITINCDGTDSCRSTQFQLHDTRNVVINCRGNTSCQSAKFYLTPSIPLQFEDITTIICHDTGSCQSVNIWDHNADELYIQCKATLSCSGMQVTASSVDVLDINCAGIYSCQELNAISLDNTARCTVDCIGASSCLVTDVSCPAVSNCDINCNNDCVDLTVSMQQFTPLQELNCVTAKCAFHVHGYGTSGVDEYFRFDSDAIGYAPPLNGVIACQIANTGLCDVKCYGTDACRDATVACNNAATCNIHCRGDYSCYGITFEHGYAGYVDIICEGPYACDGTQFQLQDTNDVNVDCYGLHSCGGDFDLSPTFQVEDVTTFICHDERSCDGEISADLVDELYIQCIGNYSCDYLQVSATGVDILNINCNGSYACKQSHFQCFDVVDRCTLNCNGLRSCIQSSIVCPIELSQCHIGCTAGGSCQDMTVNVIEYHPLEVLDINCALPLSSCNQTTINCFNDNSYVGQHEGLVVASLSHVYFVGAMPLEYWDDVLAGTSQYVYDIANSWWDCGSMGGCCPYFISGGDFGCVAGVDCNIHCNNRVGGCAYKTISGEVSSALHVRCFDDQHDESCKNTLVICPNTGDRCTIDCQGHRSCENMKIYGGNVNILSVNCEANHNKTCYHTNVYGDGIPLIQVNATEADTGDDKYDSMRFFNVFANSAGQIDFVLDIYEAVGATIHGMNARITYHTNAVNTITIIYADHSPNIVIKAISRHGLELHASNAGHVEYTMYENEPGWEWWDRPKYPNSLNLWLPEANTNFNILNIDKPVQGLNLYSLNGISDYTFTLCEEWYSEMTPMAYTGNFVLDIYCTAFSNASATWRGVNASCVSQYGPNCCNVPRTDVLNWIQCIPTPHPTTDPTVDPTSDPTTGTPTNSPTQSPTQAPSSSPTPTPTPSPTPRPTSYPTVSPTTASPTSYPTPNPTFVPSNVPTASPIVSPIVSTTTASVTIVPSKSRCKLNTFAGLFVVTFYSIFSAF